MRVEAKNKEKGFTLIELMIAMALSLIVMAAIFSTFKSQQDSYVVQSQVSMAQQNLRAALYMITRDVQMAGYYTNFVRDTYSADWDDDSSDETLRPMIYALNDVSITGVKENSDILVVIKASDEGRALTAGEVATSGDSANASLTMTSLDLDGDGADDLTYSVSGTNKFGLLVKNDLSRAELFEIEANTNDFIFGSGLRENYGQGDLVYTADVIIYRVDTSDPDHPSLVRKNLGKDSGYQVIAENVDNLQLSFMLSDGSETNIINTNDISEVRAVKVYILARSANVIRGYSDPNTYTMGSYTESADDGYMRRLLSSNIKTRNIGL